MGLSANEIMIRDWEKHILMLSGGRDSTAMCELMLSQGKKIDYIIFTDTGQEFSLMYEYLKKVDKRFRKVYGIGITYLRTGDTFDDWVFGKITRGERIGAVRGLPLTTVPCFWKRESKVNPVARFIKKKKIFRYKTYIGYTYSEQERMSTIDENMRYPLIEAKMCEADVDRLLESVDLVNPLYELFSRTGCAICPYQSLQAYYTVWKNFKDTWQYMVDIEDRLHKLDDVINKRWHVRFKLSELEKRFLTETHWTDVPAKACECAI